MKEWKRGFFWRAFTSRPHIRVILARVHTCAEREIPSEGKFRISAVNTGLIPAEITEIGISRPRNCRKPVQLSEILLPGEEIHVYFDAADLTGLGRYDVVYAKNREGRRFYPPANLFGRIARWWWWRFGGG